MKIKIIKADKNKWYKNLIGRTYHVKSEWKEWYVVRNYRTILRMIRKKDAEILSEEANDSQIEEVEKYNLVFEKRDKPESCPKLDPKFQYGNICILCKAIYKNKADDCIEGKDQNEKEEQEIKSAEEMLKPFIITDENYPMIKFVSMDNAIKAMEEYATKELWKQIFYTTLRVAEALKQFKFE